MNLSNPELLDQLASEYVLGTMADATRRRFARLLKQDLIARRAVIEWEQRLTSIVHEITPIAPPDRVWQQIEAAIEGVDVGRPMPNKSSRVVGWLAAMFAFATLGLSLLYFGQSDEPLTPAFTSVLQDGEKTPTFIVDAIQESLELKIRAFAPETLPAGSIYQLWLVPADGGAPVSLGLLGQGEVKTLSIDRSQLSALNAGGVLAISIEPDGGSPTGAPTGAIPFSGALTSI